MTIVWFYNPSFLQRNICVTVKWRVLTFCKSLRVLMVKHKKPSNFVLPPKGKIIIFLKFQPWTLQTISKEIYFAVD